MSKKVPNSRSCPHKYKEANIEMQSPSCRLLCSDSHIFNFRFNCVSSALLLCQAMECTCSSLEVNLTYCCIYSVHFYRANSHSSTLCQESSYLAINYVNDGSITASQTNVFLVPLICILKQLHYYNVF